MRLWRRLLMTVAAVATVGMTLAPVVATAESPATSCLYPTSLNGRSDCYGYFTGQVYPFDNSWDFVISGGMEVTTANPTASEADFINRMQSALFGSNARDVIGAAFLVDVMMGKDGPVYGCSQINGLHPAATATACRNNGVGRAVDGARSLWPQFVQVVHYYNNKRYIRWDDGWDPCAAGNTFYENSAMSATSIFDVTYHSKIDCSRIIPTIWFNDPNTSTDMRIQRICGNMLGNANSLELPNYILDPRLSTGINTPAWGGTVTPGQQYYLTAYLHNTGSWSPPNPAVASRFDSDITRLEVSRLTGGQYVRYQNPIGPNSGGVGSQTTAPLPGGYTSSGCMYSPALDEYGQPTCWYWNYANGLIKNSYSTQGSAVHFMVVGNPPEGQQICFRISVKDYNVFDGDTYRTVDPVTGDNYCFTVHKPRYPSVKGYNSDIHAGGSVCGSNMAAPAGVYANTGANSFGDYVVSAASLTNLTGFGSSGDTNGGGVLKLGQTGDYGAVCRPNLIQTATEYKNTGGGYGTLVGGTYDVGALDPTQDVFFATGVINLKGTVNRKLTIISLVGSINIIDDITLTNATATRANLPSLGIIAANNINIYNAAQTVDAYMFADNQIDTCFEGNASATACNSVLTVHGFAMAHEIVLHRLGPSGSTDAQDGEKMILNPQIYLNPPKIFDALSNDILLDGQGEKPPLF